MESELGNDTVNGPFADPETALSKFLSDDFGAGLGIQEAVTNDLTDEFLGAPVIGFGAALGTEQSLAAFLKKEGAKLEVTLTTITEFSSGPVNAFGATFAVDEHGKFPGDFVMVSNGQRAEFALNTFAEKFQRDHGASWAERQKVYLNMAQHSRKGQGDSESAGS